MEKDACRRRRGPLSFFPTPNYFGILEDYTAWPDTFMQQEALLIMTAAHRHIGAIKSPGEWGGRHCPAGEAQSSGCHSFRRPVSSATYAAPKA